MVDHVHISITSHVSISGDEAPLLIGINHALIRESMVIWQLTRSSDYHVQLSYASICLYIHSTLYSEQTSQRRRRRGTLPHHNTYGRYEWPQIGGAIS